MLPRYDLRVNDGRVWFRESTADSAMGYVVLANRKFAHSYWSNSKASLEMIEGMSFGCVDRTDTP